MIGKRATQSLFSRAASKYGAMVTAGNRGFAGGGPKKAAIDPKCTDFDVVLVGGMNSTVVLKNLQANDDAQDLKMCIVTPTSKFVQPVNYYPCTHGHAAPRVLESGAVSGMVTSWSKAEIGVSVDNLDVNANSMTLSNGKNITYKSLMLAPGLDHDENHIKGLSEML
jgi:NADH dehydrogenase FAD-containing subunit